MSYPKIAVIGTGAAGFGALAALLEKEADFEIVVYDIGQRVRKISPPENPSEEWINDFYDKVYREIRSLHPFKFPPPKTHFARQIPRQAVGQRLNIFKSESFGGLTNYWGATMLPFTDREMAKWPIKKEALESYYRKIAEKVGLAGQPDGLNKYFLRDFATRPPIQPLPTLAHLSELINQQESQGQFEIISGLNRCGVETRDNQPNQCVYCGQCLAGCFRDSIYSTRQTIGRYLKNHRIRYIQDRVRRINQKNNSWEIQTEKGLSESGFAKVFLGAGCPDSTEILMNSFGLRQSLTMADNAVYVFPILYLGKISDRANYKNYLSLCNLIIGCIPQQTNEHFIQVQVYPNFDYLWRYNLPPALWSIIQPLVAFSRPRLFWCRLYLHSDYSQAYSVELADGQLAMDKIKETNHLGRLNSVMSSLRSAINHQKFYLLPVPPILQKVNSHYAATLPFNNNILRVAPDGQVAPNLYLSDSACFPDSPAINPGFTIMANAWRIADQALT